MNQTTKGRIDMIVVRLNRIVDSHVVRELFTEMVEQTALLHSSARLCKSEQVENDWAVWLHHPAVEGKPAIVENLVEALGTLGIVHHTVWICCDPGVRMSCTVKPPGNR